MATELIVRPENMKLIPVTSGDQELIGGLANKDFVARLTTASKRSLLQNRFYWALLGKVVENSDHYTNTTGLHFFLKVRLGYVEEIQFHNGQMVTRVASTAFDRMDSEDFRLYLEACINVICTEIIPGLRRYDLTRETETMLGLSYDALWQEKAA